MRTLPPRSLAFALLIGLALGTVPVASSLEAQNLSFSDQTAAAGVANVFLPGFFAHSHYSGGGAVGDFDRDGDQDLFVPSDGENGEPDRLFINDGNGTFTDQAAAWGLTVAHMGKGPAVGDFNNDGWLDIYCTSAGPYNAQQPGHHKLYRNNGDGTFTDIATAAGVATTTTVVQDGFGCCWGDHDLDGDLDLFVAGTASGNLGSILFRNEGDETFTDVTASAGLFVGLGFTMHGFAPRLIDMDGDRYPELLLASDFGTSRYYVNDGDGTFTDFTAISGTGQEENGMGQTVGDHDNDGLLDWYVTSIYQPSTGWTGNKLYRNLGNHLYQEISVAAGVDDGGYGWGAVAVDLDHDGWQDLVETNGGFGQFASEPSYLWMNAGNGTYVEQAAARGLIHTDEGRGLLHFDADGDGDQDLIVFAYAGPLVLFRNELTGPGASWLRVFLDNGGSPAVAPDGYGARVQVTVAAQSWSRVIDGGDSFLSKSELSAHFGLGTAAFVDELRVEWPDGTITVQTGVAVDQTLTVTYPATTPAPFRRGDPNVDGSIDIADAIALLGALFTTPGLPCRAAGDTNGDGGLDIADPIHLLAYAFTQGPPPPAPFPDCGPDPATPLDCDTGC